ncbi:MAG: beta-ketoacyl-[acyl-carrier-protein] synthase family protein [Verrucomicrobiia bacterium]
MNRVFVTGLGLITSIGNSKEAVLDSLRHLRTGIELFEPFQDPSIPVKMAGTVKGFSFPSTDVEDWSYPGPDRLRREQLRPMTPNALYAFCAMKQAIADAGLREDEVSSPRTCLMTASGGSMWLTYENYKVMLERGVMATNPMGVVNGIPGSLYINLGSLFKIKGGALGFSSACASSAHAAGHAIDLIRMGRHDRAFVVGAEDCNLFSSVPFCSIRALSVQTDPERYPCAFDRKRDGFIGTGGATVLVLESEKAMEARGATPYVELLGWGQSSDGFNVVAPEPHGEGLARCMALALEDAAVEAEAVDYINAHATGTTVGDLAEARAIASVFPEGQRPHVSSTKSLTGHGLSLAGAMELAFTVLALKEGFTPVSAHITDLDPACAMIPVVTTPIPEAPSIAMSNSSGFGGSNVSVVARKV